MSRALAKPGAYLSVGKRQAVYDAAMQACDALDGVADGLISDQRQCNERFDPSIATLNSAPLRCPEGADTGDHCLSDAQIDALTTDTAGVPARTRPLCDYPKWARYQGGDVNHAVSFRCVD